MSIASFDQLRAWLHLRSGIALDQSKRYLLETRLTPLVKAHGLQSIDALADRLRSAPTYDLEQNILNALATTESSFFRDIAVFEGLRATLLPRLIARRQSEKRLNIWCAACANGQEVYSLAILLQSEFPELARWTIRILASDLSTEMLERAKRGRFTQLEVNRGLPAKHLIRFFREEGSEWQIDDGLRRSIEFRQINLTTAWPALGQMDLILMRNVLIYFDMPTKQSILRKVRTILQPDGYLLLGASESTLTVDPAFDRVQLANASSYRLASASK